ncbi:hypothetical protein G7Z17_g4792 [Cylindrodendrum hubeiense]|uniref:Uncharacterized protein n=1 Tax=Cylindrodendrum hubeiense TaxID=595255 RepID=A0A9P5HG59_9HYPO|nr:hypothetical protein G7Z17_g4792 [Cylindrodendrum hubeiense]
MSHIDPSKPRSIQIRAVSSRLSSNARAGWLIVRKTIRTGYSPWDVGDSLAKDLLEAPPAEQSATIQRFIDIKQRELEIVMVSAIASLVGSLMSWGWFPVPPYTTKIALLCALIHSLLATAIATQQFLLVGRIAVSRQRDRVLLSVVLGSDPDLYERSQLRPRRLFSFAWQSPTVLLGSSIMFLLVGIAIHVYDAAHSAGLRA